MSDYSFNCSISDVDVYGINQWLNVSDGIDVDVSSSVASVEYSLHPVFRSWGIKRIPPLFVKVTITILWDIDCRGMSLDDVKLLAVSVVGVWQGEPECRIYGTTVIESNGPDEWHFTEDILFQPDGSFYVNRVCADLVDHLINIE